MKELSDSLIASPMAVPWVETMSVLMVLRNILAEMKSLVIGSWV